jgi:hypothetical protein
MPQARRCAALAARPALPQKEIHMSYSTAPPAAPGPLPPGRYAVQLVAPRDPPPSGRYAIERVGVRNVDDPTQAEFALCTPIDLVRRELRTNDRVHAMWRHRGAIRHILRRVEAKGETLLLYPMRRARGPKAKPINAADVVVVGLVTGAYTQFRV